MDNMMQLRMALQPYTRTSKIEWGRFIKAYLPYSSSLCLLSPCSDYFLEALLSAKYLSGPATLYGIKLP